MATSDRRTTAADVVSAALVDQAATLRAHEVALRSGTGSPGAYRTAALRLRATVAGYAPLMDQGEGRRVRAGLREVAAHLTAARDADAVRGRLRRATGAASGGLPPEVVAAVVEWLPVTPPAWSFLDSPEHDDLTRLLDRYVDLPPWQRSAAKPARSVLPRVVASEWDRLVDRSQRAVRSVESHRSGTWRSAYGAALRSRTVCEVAEPALGRKVRRMAKAAKRLQHTLRDHLDGVLTVEALQRAAREAGNGDLDLDVLRRVETFERDRSALSELLVQQRVQALGHPRVNSG